jgi:DNA invertase Pin-like site-specific DNA recombinase
MKAYSYIRWSTPQQTGNDSLTRQIKSTEEFCKMKGWNLDKELKVDAGVSSYGGDNVRKGALGEFINAVDCGLIKTPCVLILEQLDRLTRMKLRDARRLFESLLEKGVKICVSNSGKIYDEASLDNPFDLFFSIMELSAAHEYAASIGRRSGAAWKRKKERAKTGEILTKTCPAWLRVTGKIFEVIPSRCKIVQKIFSDYVNGFGYRASLVPVPADVLQAGYEAQGYDWENNHWGCKWGACHGELIDDNGCELFYSFDTAWAPPIALMKDFWISRR